jgi:hypothetical protein
VPYETVKYGYKDPSLDLLRRSYFHLWDKIILVGTIGRRTQENAQMLVFQHGNISQFDASKVDVMSIHEQVALNVSSAESKHHKM